LLFTLSPATDTPPIKAWLIQCFEIWLADYVIATAAIALQELDVYFMSQLSTQAIPTLWAVDRRV
jgi:hypothetical protein